MGYFLLLGFGTTLHFWFEWTDYWRPMALIAAVNESTWEHFKMAFWPGLIFALIEYPFIKNDSKNFVLAKFAGLMAMPIITMILFYGYTALTGTHMLWADIIVFILSVIGGQWLSYLILTRLQKTAAGRSKTGPGWISPDGFSVFASELLSPQEFYFCPSRKWRVWHFKRL